MASQTNGISHPTIPQTTPNIDNQESKQKNLIDRVVCFIKSFFYCVHNFFCTLLGLNYFTESITIENIVQALEKGSLTNEAVSYIYMNNISQEERDYIIHTLGKNEYDKLPRRTRLLHEWGGKYFERFRYDFLSQGNKVACQDFNAILPLLLQVLKNKIKKPE